MSVRKSTKSSKASTLVPAYVTTMRDSKGQEKVKAVAARTSFPIPNADQLTEKQLDRRQRNLTTAEFNAQLSLLQKEATDLLRMAVKVGKAGKAGVQTESLGVVTTKELTALLKDHNRKVKSLADNYSATSHRRKKEGKARGPTRGAYLRQPMIDFLRNANLGTLSDGTRVSDLIAPYLDAGVLTQTIMTQLLTYYRNNNPSMNFTVTEANAKGEPTEYKRMRATADMKKFLGPYLAQLAREKPGFNADNFSYKYLTALAALGMVSKDELSEEQRVYADDEQNKLALSDLQATLKAGKA